MTSDTTTLTNTIDISLNDTKQPERTFLGELIIDAVEPARIFDTARDSGHQFHLAVKPLNFQLRGETGAFHSYVPIRYSQKTGELIKSGEFGRVTEALRETFKTELTKRGMELRRQAVEAAKLDGKDTAEISKKDPLDFVKVGQGHFLGLQGVFAMRTLEYGQKPNGETIRGGRASLIALKVAKPEEVAAAQAQLSGGSAQPDLQYTPEQVQQLVDVMDGKTQNEYLKGIGRKGLPGDVVNAVTSGVGLRYLQEKNLVTVDESGTVRRVS